jgi:hypothetical protein
MAATAEVVLGQEAVVLRAKQPDVVRLVTASPRERMAVVELEPLSLGAAPALFIHESAASPSRSRTARLTAAGTWREATAVSVSASVLRGAMVLPKRARFGRSSVSVTARSTTAPRSPSGTSERRSAASRSSLSRSAALAVNWTLKRAGASGSTTAFRDGGGRQDNSSRDEFVG